MLEKQQLEIFENVIRNINYILDPATFEFGWEHSVVSISGAAGTGKTFLLAEIIKSLQNKYKIAITTPTHQSLGVLTDKVISCGADDLKLNFSTIHSFLNLKLQIDYATGNQTFVADNFKKDTKKYDILVLDESSMISEEMFNNIKLIIGRRVKAVLFVGDFYQLEPVDGEPNKITDIKWSYELTDIQRQVADSEIIKEATYFRDSIKNKQFKPLSDLFGRESTDDVKIFASKDEFLSEYYSDDKIKMVTAFTNNSVDSYNKMIRNKVYGENIGNYIVGEKLIFQDNLYEDDVCIHLNGDIITIKDIELKYDNKIMSWYWDVKSTKPSKFKIIDEGSMNNFNFYLDEYKSLAIQTQDYKEKRKLWKKYYDLKGKYANVKYAFAGTVHKMQGTTVHSIYFDLRELVGFDYGHNRESLYRLIYVAITRPSDKLVILI